MKEYSATFKVLSSDCDRYAFWRLNSMMILLQELAGEHSQRLGWGRDNTLAQNAVWIVTRNELVIDRYPKISQEVIGRTFPGVPRRGIYPRYYHITDQEGNSLLRASSFWVLADVNTRQMTNIPRIAGDMPDAAGLTPPLHNPRPADCLQEGLQRQLTWQPLYTDIDQNGHVNNTRAADWAQCFLGETADLARHPVRSLRVSYSREILPQDQVDMDFRLNEKAFGLTCRVADAEALRLSGELWQEEH